MNVCTCSCRPSEEEKIYRSVYIAFTIHSNHLFLLLLLYYYKLFLSTFSTTTITHKTYPLLLLYIHELWVLSMRLCSWHPTWLGMWSKQGMSCQARNNTKRKQKVWISLCMLYLEEMVKMVKYFARERYLRDADAASIHGMCRVSMVDVGCELHPYFTTKAEPKRICV